MHPFGFGDSRDWFVQHRYGMFVHWGLYAINGWHEQEQWRGRVPRSEYVRLAEKWNPSRFDPEQWLDLLQAAGMSYICLTTKHHDGFCLWDTAQTPYNTMNTPYGKDIVGMLADACHRRNIPLCLYYSIADWHHPTYPNLGRHHELPPQPGDTPDWDRYMAFLTEQVRELCTNYGTIHGFWWDMNVPEHKDESVNALIRALQPSAVINNRGFDDGDFGTPERDYDRDDRIAFDRRTEACQSVGMESWGYRHDENYYTDRHLMRSIDRYLARGANYLLNVGPKADGTIPEEAASILLRLGNWYGRIRESVEDVETIAGVVANPNLLLTRRGDTLYVHLHRDSLGDAVKLKPLQQMPRSVTLLNTGEPLRAVCSLAPSDHADQKAYLRIENLPANEMANTVLVLKLEFDDLASVLGSLASESPADSAVSVLAK